MQTDAMAGSLVLVKSRDHDVSGKTAGARTDVSIRFPSSDVASLDKFHRWRPCRPAKLEVKEQR